MKVIGFSFIIAFSILLNAQNFFPTQIGDAYQFRTDDGSTITYSSLFVTEYIISGTTYLKIDNKYYRFDSTANKLYILLNGQEKLAMDFTLPAGATVLLYFSGYGRSYTCSGTYYDYFLGQQRAAQKITTTGDGTLIYTFVADVGYYSEHFYRPGYSNNESWVISAKIGSTILNPIRLNISPVIPESFSRTNGNFGIYASISGIHKLVDTLRAEVVIYEAGSVSYESKFIGNIPTQVINGDIPISYLAYADSVGIRVVCTDRSIFNNKATYPLEGYHFVPVEGAVPWQLLFPVLNEPFPKAMKFFSAQKGFIQGSRIDPGNPPASIKNYTTDGGSSFIAENIGLDNLASSEIIRLDSLTGFKLLSFPNEVKKTTNSGNTWFTLVNILDYSTINSFDFINESTGWIAASSSTSNVLLHTSDGGSTWNTFTGLPVSFKVLDFIDINRGFGLSANGHFYKTINSGVNWSLVNNQLSNYKRIYIFPSESGWATGAGVAKTSDGGVTWINKFAGTIVDAHFFDENSGWIIGSTNQGKVLAYTSNGGDNWINFDTPVDSYIFIDFIDRLHGWVLCNNNGLLRTDNGGGFLPVELTSFTGKTSGDYAELSWVTESELNNYGFEIELKHSDNEWYTTAFVKGAGTSTKRNDYYFRQVLTEKGKYFFRLKQIDYDGTFKYSHLVELDFVPVPKKNSLLQNYPNPFNPSTKIKYSLKQKEIIKIKIYNILGTEVAVLFSGVQDGGEYEIEFNPADLDLPSGVYLYNLRSSDFSETRKMIYLK